MPVDINRDDVRQWAENWRRAAIELDAERWQRLAAMTDDFISQRSQAMKAQGCSPSRMRSRSGTGFAERRSPKDSPGR